MNELKSCPFCGAEHKNLMGYGCHKVGCSNIDCKIYGIAFEKDAWNTRAPQSEWVSVEHWEKVDCDPVWIAYSHLTDLGVFTGSDKAYWNAGMNCWSGFGLGNALSNGAVVRYVMPLPTPPKGLK